MYKCVRVRYYETGAELFGIKQDKIRIYRKKYSRNNIRKKYIYKETKKQSIHLKTSAERENQERNYLKEIFFFKTE